MSPSLRLVIGECHDPDHVGLRRLLTDRSLLTDPEADTSELGDDVSALHLLAARLCRENKDLMLGRERQYSDGLLFAWSLAFATFVVGAFASYLIFGGC